MSTFLGWKQDRFALTELPAKLNSLETEKNGQLGGLKRGSTTCISSQKSVQSTTESTNISLHALNSPITVNGLAA